MPGTIGNLSFYAGRERMKNLSNDHYFIPVYEIAAFDSVSAVKHELVFLNIF